MTKTLYLLIIFFITQHSYAQKIKFSYKNIETILEYDLLIDEISNTSQWKLTKNAKGEEVINFDSNNLFFRNNDIYYLSDKTLKRRFLVKDIPVFNWSFDDKMKVNILGYTCNVASVIYRGRKFNAYYTTQIPLKFGPWKFNGLNGLILKVESDDGLYKFEATNIDLNYFNDNLSKSFKSIDKYTFNSWDEFTKFYLSDLEKYIEDQKCNCDTDGRNELKISRIEKIHPELHDLGVVF